uniref:CSON009847 protein n=1 Tax=Culicoides sonorensis TaxID=179676 RepID=A0A336N0C3_CULSO
MQVCFDSKWTIKGCIIQDYLLEQSRITFQSPDERNYHVLYQLVAEAKCNKELATSLHIKDPSFYQYLNASGDIKIDIGAEQKRFEALRLAFNVLQIPQNIIDGIFKVLSAILWLGNLTFQDIDGENCELVPDDKEIVCTVAELLGLQDDDLKQCCLKRQINYRQEEIVFSHIQFTDNTQCLELIEKPPRCILKMLTEQCHMPKGSDTGYLTNLHSEFENHPSYEKAPDRRRWETEFIVKHYAGCVAYTVKGFVDKNRDVQQDVLFDFMSRSQNPFVQELSSFQDLLSILAQSQAQNLANGLGTVQRNTSKGKLTVSDMFRQQLQALVDVLQSTNPWYVRCIKPNADKLANDYDDQLVLDQLKYLGMLDIIRIRREGFPIHLSFEEFIYRYKCLTRKTRTVETIRNQVLSVIAELNVPGTEWQLGKTKVFLRNKVHEPLEDSRNRVINGKAIVIQRNFKKYLEQKKFSRTRLAALKIQHAYRGWKQRIQFLKMRRAAIVIQSHLRGVFAREVAAALREMRRVEEEMRKRERLEAERKQREAEQAEADRLALEESERAAKQEIMALSQMAEQINSKLSSTSSMETNGMSSSSSNQHSNESVDLDNLFAFLSEVAPSSASSQTSQNANQIINEIGEKMDNLVEDLDVELESVIQQEIEGLTNERNTINNNNANVTKPKLGVPSLPEPKEPPPPPPVKPVNGNANKLENNATQNAKVKRTDEPIYEAVTHLHLQHQQNMHQQQMQQVQQMHQMQQMKELPMPPLPPVPEVSEALALENQPPPPPPHAHNLIHENGTHKLRPKSPAVLRSQSPQNRSGPMSPSSPKHSRPSSRGSTGDRHHGEREQRRKYRVEKKLQEMHQLDITEREDKHLREDIYNDILEFAENHFNTHERSPEGTIMATLTRKGKKNVDLVPKYEMITYYRGNSIPSSHIHMYDPENVQIACNIFRELCKYLRGELNGERELSVIQFIIGQGIEREEVRDEIFVQCMRQATNNPHSEWTDRVWLLLCLTIVAFQPSKLLFKYFVSFLKKNLEQLDGKLRQYVQWCMDNCKNTKVSSRLLPPSSVEVAAMRRLGTIVCRFFFLDGRTKAIDVHPTDTASDAVAKLAEKLGLCSIEGWAIYQSRPDGEEHVKSHDYLYDVIAAWEIKQTKIQATNSLRKNAATLGSGENRFVFKKRIFKGNRELSQDPIEVNMLYAQAVYGVVKCDEFPVSEKVALQLAGLQAQVALGNPAAQPKPEYYSDIGSFLPERISKTREDHFWIPILAQAHKQYGSGRSELTAKVLYLSCVMQYPLYGTTMFNVSYRGYWSYGNTLILGVNWEGIVLIKPDDKFVLFEFRYHEIESIMLDPSDSFITINLNQNSTRQDQQKCFVFETTQKQEIGSLIVSYFPALSNWITENEIPAKKAKGITNEDRVRLHHNIVVCRRHLVDSELLRKPMDLSGGFLRNTLRRLSKHRLEKLRAEHGSYTAQDHGETYKGFPHAYWAFSRQPLPQSLSKLPDQEEQAMLQVFQSILTYAGLGTNGEVVQRAEDEHITLIQSIMDRCMRKESLLNELYLQLVKQTTDHPDPNSRVNLRHWALLSLACSVILPTQKVVRKYLIGHLKRCASDFISEEGKYARFAEKCFFKTQGTRRRQWPPSREEIVCTINRRPIYARFHFMDGQYHSVEFHPSSTAREVMEIVKKKIGLQEGAQGYAIYEVLGASERSLLPDEKIADVMSKWEKYRTAAAQAVQQNQNSTSNLQASCRRQHHLFLFKKHLFCDQFMNLEDPVEKELLYHQVLHGLRTERFPISEMEAIMLTSLQSQLELGDCGDTPADYRLVASHCLPPRFVPNIPHDGVAMHHQSLRGMTQAEAKKSFLNLIQSWPLHKSTIFDVMQSFTSNWPRVLWLAVDQKGLHLLEHRSRNTLCTYDYGSILSFSPNMNCLMIITGSDKKQSKVILTTSQAFQIANLIREYMEVIQLRLEEQQKQLMNDPMTQSNRAAATAALQQHNAKGGSGTRPPSAILRQGNPQMVAPQPS